MIVVDNTVLSNFAQAQFDSAIISLWGDQICTTPEVISEYRTGIEAVGLPSSAWGLLKITKLSSSENDFAASLSIKLGPVKDPVLQSHTCEMPFWQQMICLRAK